MRFIELLVEPSAVLTVYEDLFDMRLLVTASVLLYDSWFSMDFYFYDFDFIIWSIDCGGIRGMTIWYGDLSSSYFYVFLVLLTSLFILLFFYLPSFVAGSSFCSWRSSIINSSGYSFGMISSTSSYSSPSSSNLILTSSCSLSSKSFSSPFTISFGCLSSVG